MRARGAVEMVPCTVGLHCDTARHAAVVLPSCTATQLAEGSAVVSGLDTQKRSEHYASQRSGGDTVTQQQDGCPLVIPRYVGSGVHIRVQEGWGRGAR